MAVSDPYKVLGIPHSATDAEIRAAYRRQVQLTHPDHNGGSPESTRRFEEVQEAYAMIRKLQQGATASSARRGSASSARGGSTSASSRRRASSPPPRTEPVDPGLEARLAELDRELKRQREAKQQAERNAQRIREDALRQAREAARADGDAPSDEELGYVTTDDSFSAIFDDAAAEWSKRFSEAKPKTKAEHDTKAEHETKAKSESKQEPVTERLADLFDGWGARLRGEKQREKD
jgi:curved DNA-binding protein CbpA